MNDAYTIGLTLALDDGVSAGIATIRRELSSLDKAVSVSTANLVRLQEVARNAVSAGVAQAGAMAARTRESAAAAVRQSALHPQPPDLPNTEIAAAGPVAWPERTAATVVPAPPLAMLAGVASAAETTSALPARALPELAQPTSPSAKPDPVRRTVSPAGEIVTQSAAPAAAAAPAAVTQSAPIAPVEIPPVAAPLTPSIPAPNAPAAPPLALARLAEPAVPPPVQPGPKPAISVALALPAAAASRVSDHASAPTVYHEHRLAPAFTPPPQPEMPSPPSMAPPTYTPQMAPARQTPDRPFGRERGSSAAPRQQSERQRDKGMSGTITLDGAELGRWTADYLAHAASRPPRGGAAFDPRMAPVWAGAPIGA